FVTREKYDVAIAERDKAYGYMSRLFLHLAPQCKALPDILGVATQLDNYIAGQHIERDRLAAALAAAEARNVELQRERDEWKAEAHLALTGLETACQRLGIPKFPGRPR